MADFKSALEALAKGKLDIDVLSKQLDKLLQAQPKFANRMLIQLDESYEQKNIDDKAYANLKRQINQFRRTHAAETEDASEAGGDSTQFAQDSIPQQELEQPQQPQQQQADDE